MEDGPETTMDCREAVLDEYGKMGVEIISEKLSGNEFVYEFEGMMERYYIHAFAKQ